MDDLEIMDLSTDDLIKAYEEIKNFMDELDKEVKTLEESINEKRNNK